MSPPFPITFPAGYAPAFALGYADNAGDFALVALDAPLPVQNVDSAQVSVPVPAPLEGSATTTVAIGPFAPAANLPVVLSLAGAWQGTVQLERSTDNGATRLPVTVGGAPWGRFSANACEPVWIENEDGAELYLAIAVTSGTLSYRIAQ